MNPFSAILRQGTNFWLDGVRALSFSDVSSMETDVLSCSLSIQSVDNEIVVWEPQLKEHGGTEVID